MKCYVISRWGKIESHIAVTADRKIAVGEEGRGRELVLVPVPGNVPLQRIEGTNRYRLSDVPGGHGALLLIRDQSGFRGSWTLGGQFGETGCPEGQRIPWDDEHRLPDGRHGCPRCGRREYHSSLAAGTIPGGVRILAEGRCAQGMAGRMGGGPEYLLFAPPGTVLSVDRSGRTYGTPARYHIVVEEDGTVTLTDVVLERRSAKAESAFIALLNSAIETPAGE